MSIVTPKSLFNLNMFCKNLSLATGSSCDVGSSSISILGCITITDARFNICFWPPDNSSVFFSYQPLIPKYSDISAIRLYIVSLSNERLSSPKASSCQTLSVTICPSGLCPTYPINAALSRSSINSMSFPSKYIFPLPCPVGI